MNAAELPKPGKPRRVAVAAGVVVTVVVLTGCQSVRRPATAPSAGSSPVATAATIGKTPAGVEPVVAAGPPWRIAHEHDYGEFDSMNVGVMVGSAEGWAFGQTNVGDELEPQFPVTLRWDGASWRTVRLPGKFEGAFLSASGSSRTDVWAVSSSETGFANVLRFDGRRWTLARRVQQDVSGVQAVGRHRVWLFGGYVGDTWFFDDGNWRRVRLPLRVTATSAASEEDVWAIGWRDDAGGDRAAVAHFDGRTWGTVSLGSAFGSPNDQAFTQFTSVHAAARDDVWVFGTQTGPSTDHTGEGASDGQEIPVAARWNGRLWSQVPVPHGWQLGAVIGGTRGAVHVAATKMDQEGNADYSAVLSRREDGSWTISNLPHPPGAKPFLSSFARVAATGELYGFGFIETDDGDRTSAIFVSDAS
ncbi:hypothetical protein [Microtetraspora malaysiensis]|uniref:hypothetical protein n=1 Tax=Microtetraspora malaysiensis TaxID=161358 RepID=UPI000AA81838|nr:hypothetical protein [Microtetraspora malaysiensis]